MDASVAGIDFGGGVEDGEGYPWLALMELYLGLSGDGEDGAGVGVEGAESLSGSLADLGFMKPGLDEGGGECRVGVVASQLRSVEIFGVSPVALGVGGFGGGLGMGGDCWAVLLGLGDAGERKGGEREGGCDGEDESGETDELDKLDKLNKPDEPDKLDELDEPDGFRLHGWPAFVNFRDEASIRPGLRECLDGV
jgi:hypothetical protein